MSCGKENAMNDEQNKTAAGQEPADDAIRRAAGLRAERDTLAARVRELEAERDKAISARQHTEDWYGSRWQRLHDWFRSPMMRGTEAAEKWFDIVANGSAMDDPPVSFMAAVNLTRFQRDDWKRRAETAEAALAEARDEIKQYQLTHEEGCRMLAAARKAVEHLSRYAETTPCKCRERDDPADTGCLSNGFIRCSRCYGLRLMRDAARKKNVNMDDYVEARWGRDAIDAARKGGAKCACGGSGRLPDPADSMLTIACQCATREKGGPFGLAQMNREDDGQGQCPNCANPPHCGPCAREKGGAK